MQNEYSVLQIVVIMASQFTERFEKIVEFYVLIGIFWPLNQFSAAAASGSLCRINPGKRPSHLTDVTYCLIFSRPFL